MKEQTASKTPKIRFKGHSETWRTESVSSLLTERNVQAPKSEQYPLMAFIAGQGVAPKGKRYNREFLVSDELNKKYKQTELGDFIYSSNNLETGSIGTNNYGSASISPVYSIFSPTLEGDSSFIGQLLCKKAFINEMVKWRQGVVYGQWRIHESDFLKIKATFPTVDEQTQIGKYFRELDRLIGLHQSKHDKLVTLKKAMLQKMFPQPGATTPEIRFKGFSEEWIEKKLSEAGEFNPKAELPEIFEYVDLESVVGTAMINHRTETRKTAPSRAQRLARQGDLFFQTVRPYQKNNHLFTLPFTNYVFSTGYAQIRPFNDGSFLLGLMQRDQFVKVVLDHCTGTSYPAINANVLAEILVMIPSPEEQQKIGTYFRTLDELISKYATQLQKLQQIKSACLEKMFV